MGTLHLRAALSLLRQGTAVGWDFGLRSVEELARVAELIQHSVYQAGSLERTDRGVAFVLLNPPLRMGAFSSATIHWDGALVPPTRATVAAGARAQPRPLESITREQPLIFPLGEPTRFDLVFDQVASGHHAVRLELRSVAIPPLVWMEFTDSVHDAGHG